MNGKRRPNSGYPILTPDQVTEARALYGTSDADGQRWSCPRLGARYGVSHVAIWKVVTNRTHKKVAA